MKKLSALIATSLIAGSMITSTAFAGDLKMKVNGKAIKFQYGTPFIENGSSLIPLRDLLVSLGVPNDNKHIIWHSSTQSVTAINEETTIKLSVGQKEIYRNGKLFQKLEVPAKNVDGRVFLPARAVAEALGNQVGYDAKTGTVVIEKSKTTSSNSISFDVGSLKDIVATATNHDVQLSDASYQLLLNYKELFFGNDREKRSLKEKASEVSEDAIAKNVSAYQERIITTTSIKIDEVKEQTLSDGSILTLAIGHTGGTLSPITKTYINETYFQIIFVGSTNILEGDYAYVYGLPVGETTVILTDTLGNTTEQPMYVIVAGNFLTQMEYINDQKPSTDFTVNGEKPSTAYESALKNMRVSMINDEFNISYLSVDVPSLQIQKIEAIEYHGSLHSYTSYIYEPSSPLIIKAYDTSNIEISKLATPSGKRFEPSNGDSFDIVITTDKGKMTKYVEYLTTGNRKTAEGPLQLPDE